MSDAPLLPMVWNAPKVLKQTAFAVNVERTYIYHNALLFEQFRIGQGVRQNSASVAAQCPDKDGLGLAVQIVFAAVSSEAPRFSQRQKPGGFVTCTPIPTAINKGFGKQYWMTIDSFPVSGQTS